MRLVPLLTLLLTMTLVATSLSRGAGAHPGDSAPLYPISPAPLPPSTECNRPASDMPPAPDGCPDYAPIAPPPAPIPPPCIVEARVEQWNEDDATVTEFSTYVDHPETCPEPCRRIASGARTYTKLTHIQHSAFSIQHSEWELVDADWEASCGKDEGPLVWVLLEVLNAGRWDALNIYTSPLPEEYLAVLTELAGLSACPAQAGLRNFTYLPYLEVQP